LIILKDQNANKKTQDVDEFGEVEEEIIDLLDAKFPHAPQSSPFSWSGFISIKYILLSLVTKLSFNNMGW
jgi:hypothetical protein